MFPKQKLTVAVFNCVCNLMFCGKIVIICVLLLGSSEGNYTGKKLIFNHYGEPFQVIKLVEETLDSVIDINEVVVKFLLAPINPSDVNYIEGVYPVKANLPEAVPGFEGVGEVVDVGSNVTSLEKGDLVLPNTEQAGTWRSYATFNPDDLTKVPEEIDKVLLAGFNVNIRTAYRLLNDFVDLQPGDSIIQNAANSACGQNIIQLCKLRNITSINIVRNRENINDLVMQLMTLGADYVLTEEDLRNTTIFESGLCPKPKLALNAVGGDSSLQIARRLSEGGIMVTYGGMAKEPVEVLASSFIFKDIKLIGFWLSRWLSENYNSPEMSHMTRELFGFMKNGQLKPPPYKIISLTAYPLALNSEYWNKKISRGKFMFNLTATV